MEKITGPLGYWTFPILNIIMDALSSHSLRTDSKKEHPHHETETMKIPILVNEEKWEWTDYRGNKRDITVHRKVTPVKS